MEERIQMELTEKIFRAFSGKEEVNMAEIGLLLQRDVYKRQGLYKEEDCFFISSFLAGKEAKEAGGTYEWFPLEDVYKRQSQSRGKRQKRGKSGRCAWRKQEKTTDFAKISGNS